MRSPDASNKTRSRAAAAPAKSRPVSLSLVWLCVLLALPAYALSRLSPQVPWWVLAAGPLVVSLVAFFAYRRDKRAAEAGEWRIPESTLHLLSLFGGWPGAFLAQRAFRHKTAKLSFQLVFWATIALHQYVAADALLGWRLSRAGLQFIKAQLG